MKKVLIPTKLDPIAAETLRADGQYAVIQEPAVPLAEQVARHPDTYALIVRSEVVSAAVIDALPALKVIVRAGAGFDTIDTAHARKRDVDVMNTPGANANAVAELVVSLMLADARHLLEADKSCRAGEWEKTKFLGRELARKTVGIVGLGNIGRLVARRLAGFEVTLLGYDPLVGSERARELGAEWVDLETMFSRCDYVTLHIPENNETRGIVNEKLLSRMKPRATIINCARSGVVNEDDMRIAKKEKSLRFLNDVYPKDVAGPKSVTDIADIMLPHLGANTAEANSNAARQAAEQLIGLDRKGITSFIVNRDIPEGLDRTYCELANILARMCRSMLGRVMPLKRIETSFYGDLAPYSDYLLVPLVAGIWDEFVPGMDHRAARVFLQDRGIDYDNRGVDHEKGYGSSITVDITSETDSDVLRHISVRGTVTEGNLMVSRINEFDKLYFEPSGDMLMFLYLDRPGVIGTVGAKLASAGVNIEDMRNPHHARTNHSLVIMKINHPPPPALVQEISQAIEAISAFSFSL
ncbi:MAG: NAD(P)-dependent oxidoreductase [Verrucomicrobia bacterium]|nr:NAD(P)-dependent oxidoreductase [Verrucomicrobiota bacterium]